MRPYSHPQQPLQNVTHLDFPRWPAEWMDSKRADPQTRWSHRDETPTPTPAESAARRSPAPSNMSTANAHAPSRCRSELVQDVAPSPARDARPTTATWVE